MSGIPERVETLENHVFGQDREKPGVLMRLDRIELLLKLMVALGGIGLLWRIVDVFGAYIASRSLHP